jgi:uncharacterized protein (DUF983 family)
LAAGLGCRCPRCGQGPLFAGGFLTVGERCPVCGLDYTRIDTGDGPAFFLICVLGVVVVPLALYVAMRYEMPLWVHGILWTAVVLGLTLGMIRPAKAYLVALQYRNRPGDWT